MDVTYGLLSNLVKTRSIQRVLSPIASQISLLIILNESDDGSQLLHGEMVPCAKVVMQASHKLVTVAKQHAETSSDQEFKAQTVSACEVLELSSSNLYIAAERLGASNSSRDARNKLVQASKDVLQGTMKVLLVADDAEIRRLITATHIVTEKLSALNDATSMSELVQRFKEFTDALAVLTGISDKRQRDLIHSRQRERIISALNVLKKCIPSLSVAMQNAVKYSHNPQAQMGKSYVIGEIQEALGEIVEAVQNKDTEEEDIDLEQPGKFVSSIDKALEALGGEKRCDLHSDLEMWTEEAVRHSMTVAHLCYDNHRDLIIKTCQRVIQVKGRVVQLYKVIYNNIGETQAREDYDDVCETLTDEFCELEKNVNISLLHLVVEYFKESTEPLERLVKKAVYSDVNEVMDHADPCVTDFEEHAEKICHIASLAAASSTDARRVHSIRKSIHRLEHLDPELVPAVLSISHTPHDKGGMRHLKLLMKEWTFEMTNLIQVMDEMTDPKMFMLVSERKVEDDMNTCNGCILIADQSGFNVMLQSVIGRSRRVAMVAERIVDAHEDPLYRNGLMVFVKNLKKAITAVRNAGESISVDFTNTTHRETLKRRFELLQDSLAKVKAGLSDTNHPHVLSPLRRNVRGKHSDRKPDSKLDSLMKTAVAPKFSRLPVSSGERIIATSVPRLNLASVVREEKITPQSTATQKTEIVKSMSMSHFSKECPQTYAWRLACDLVTWATKGDRDKVNLLCGDLLGWTNHIVDVSHTVLLHSSDLKKKKEIQDACYEVDQVAPELLEKAKYVLHGDFSQLSLMKSQIDSWASQVETVRVYVDVTVDTWKSTADKVCNAAKLCKMDLVKHQLTIIQGHCDALGDLVLVAEKLRWENQVKGQDKIEMLLGDWNEVENLTVTFKTTAEMMTEQGLSEQTIQLEQLGREWSVKVFSISSTMDQLSAELLDLGLQRKIWAGFQSQEGLVETLQNEGSKLKDLMKSSCYGDDEKKSLYKELLADMTECVEELKSVTLRKKASPGLSAVIAIYTSLHKGLCRALWILKAIQCVDLARQQTCSYSGGVDAIIDKVFTVKAALGSDHETQQGELQGMLTQFSDNVAMVKRKVLQGIQLSAELQNRSLVRQCLNAINSLSPKVILVFKQFADMSGPGNHGDVLWHRLLWCSKVHHLITCLRLMSDVRPALVDEIMNLLAPTGASLDLEDITDRLNRDTMSSTGAQTSPHPEHASGTPRNVPEMDHHTSSYQHSSNSSPNHLGKTPVMQNSNYNNIPKPTRETSKPVQTSSFHLPTGSQGPVNFARVPGSQVPEVENLEPVEVDLKAVQEQLILNTSKELEARLQDAEKLQHQQQSVSSSSVMPKPALELVKTAQYIEQQTARWQDENNPIVKVAKTMATQIRQMTQYIRQEGPLTSHLALVETAKAVAENSDKILHFAHVLLKHSSEPSVSKDLQSNCLQVPLVRQQLMILANVQLGTAKSDTADRILVDNAQNLMRKILLTVTACEAVCVKGLSSNVTADSENVLVLAAQWRKRYLEHRLQTDADAKSDELGLRIVEGNELPPSLTQMFETQC